MKGREDERFALSRTPFSTVKGGLRAGKRMKRVKER